TVLAVWRGRRCRTSLGADADEDPRPLCRQAPGVGGGGAAMLSPVGGGMAVVGRRQGRRGIGGLGDWQGEGKGAADADLARDLNAATLELCEAAGDGQTEAGAAEAAGEAAVRLAEGFEDELEGALRDADAGVADRKSDLIAVGTG